MVQQFTLLPHSLKTCRAVGVKVMAECDGLVENCPQSATVAAWKNTDMNPSKLKLTQY